MTQVTNEHYNFQDYTNGERWMTYYYQISEILKCNPQKVLYCGVGDGITVKCIQKLRPQIVIDTFDYSHDLSPDIVGDITRIEETIPNRSYDCIVCCQILEHIPFEKFENIVQQLNRCCKAGGAIIISLPDRSMKFRFLFQFPLLGKIKKLICIPRLWEKSIRFDGEHYWETGNRGYMKRHILSVLAKYVIIITSYNVFESPYHWFIIAKCK